MSDHRGPMEGLLAALGVPGLRPDGGLPLVRIDGRPVTVAGGLSAQARTVAAQRGTPLVVAQAAGSGADDDPGLCAEGTGRPWPVVVAAESPWALAGADFGLLLGERGPADHDGLDPAAAAGLVRRFLDRSVDGPPAPPASARSLLDVVPFAVDGAYDVTEVLAALVDGSDWVELAAGAAPEVLTVIARIGGRSVGIVASRPHAGGAGPTAADATGGRLSPAGCERVERLLDWCERGGRPLVSLVDTAGTFVPTDAAGQETLRRVAARARSAEVTKLAVVVGRAVGLGATVLGAVGARADLVLPWPRAQLSLTLPPPGLDPAEAARLAAADRGATEGDVLDVIHPDDTRDRVIELLDVLRGRRELAR